MFVDGDCKKYLNNDAEFRVPFLSSYTEVSENRNFRKIVFPLNASNNIMSSMWEIRIKDSLQNDIVGNSNHQKDAIMLRNVMTGLYLHFNENKGLTLKAFIKSDVESNGFFFYFKMKNAWTSDNSIK